MVVVSAKDRRSGLPRESGVPLVLAQRVTASSSRARILEAETTTLGWISGNSVSFVTSGRPKEVWGSQQICVGMWSEKAFHLQCGSSLPSWGKDSRYFSSDS